MQLLSTTFTMQDAISAHGLTPVSAAAALQRCEYQHSSVVSIRETGMGQFSWSEGYNNKRDFAIYPEQTAFLNDKGIVRPEH